MKSNNLMKWNYSWQMLSLRIRAMGRAKETFNCLCGEVTLDLTHHKQSMPKELEVNATNE